MLMVMSQWNVKCLILKQFDSVIESLMTILGLWPFNPPAWLPLFCFRTLTSTTDFVLERVVQPDVAYGLLLWILLRPIPCKPHNCEGDDAF
jgi:hypothetical protein